jgi:hypothetical protein
LRPTDEMVSDVFVAARTPRFPRVVSNHRDAPKRLLQ